MKTMIAAAIALAALTSAASAESLTQRQIDQREATQQHRIQQGVRSGQLTAREYRNLEAEQARIRNMERRALADGRIDRREASEIKSAQDAASRHIYQEKHDSETANRGSWTRRWW